MPTPTTYTYSIQTAFPNDAVATDRLTQEIEASSIVIALDYVTTSADDCNVRFKDVLSGTDETTLDGLVAAHTGISLPTESIPVHLQSTAGLNAPTTSDGKPIFLPNLFPGNVTLYIAGASDGATTYGDGTAFKLSNALITSTSTLEYQFKDWLYVAGGGVFWQNAQLGDYVSMRLYAPATPVTVNGTTTGNCNLVDPGVGSAILIVPAAGNGTHDVDLATAIPVPSVPDPDDVGTGYYAWNEPDTGKGTITAGVAGASKFNLFIVAVDLARFVNRLQLLGSGAQDITVPAIKPKKILPHWKFEVSLRNELGVHTVDIAFYMMTARIKTI